MKKKCCAVLLALLVGLQLPAFAEIGPSEDVFREELSDEFYVVQDLTFEDPDLLSDTETFEITDNGGTIEIKNGKLSMTKTNNAAESCIANIYVGGKSNPFSLLGEVYVEAELTATGTNKETISYLKAANGAMVYSTQFKNGGTPNFNYGFSTTKPPTETKEWIDFNNAEGTPVGMKVKYDTESKMIDFYKNGELMTSGTTPRYARANAANVKFFNFAVKESSSNRGTMTIDNYRIYIPAENRLKIVQDQFGFGMISSQQADAITEPLNLITDTIAGVKIKWSVSEPNTVDVETGEILYQSTLDKNVTLTAGFYYEEAPDTILDTVSFPITLSGFDNTSLGFEKPVTANINVTAPENLTDGAMGTVTSTSGSEKSVQYTVDLGEEMQISRATIFEKQSDGEYVAGNVAIEVSKDNVTWTTAAECEGIGEQAVIDFPPTAAQYIRLNIKDKKVKKPIRLGEMLLYNDPIDQVIADADAALIPAVFPTYEITGDLSLMTTSKFGSTITWTSSEPEYVSNDGKFIKRDKNNHGITMTATVTYGTGRAVREFKHSLEAVKSGSSGGSGSGGGSSHKTPSNPASTVVVPTPPINNNVSDPTPENVPVFGDLDQAKWAEDYINALAKDGILSGDGSGNFRPLGNVTREEYVKMLVSALEIEPDASIQLPFTDCDPNAWYYGYVAAAYNKGLVTGVSETEFGIGQNVSRQDAAVILKRSAETSGIELETTPSGSFADQDAIADYAKEAAQYLKDAGLLSGDDSGQFNPTNQMTRAEAAKLLYMIKDAR